VWKNRDTFTRDLKTALKSAHVTIPGPVLKTVLNALGEQDDTADVCLDAKGRAEPDPSLRDTENVPWDQDIHDYFDREVRPFASDAWIDDTKTKEGAEIPFTRHFYEYVAPRPLAEIDADLDVVLGRIRARLEHVKA
jgi:type I restriction enzyme M protein